MEDLCLTHVPQQITLETSDLFTRNSARQLSYIRKFLNSLRPNSYKYGCAALRGGNKVTMQFIAW